MHLIGGCYACQPDWDAETALGLIEAERLTSLYLAPTLFHDLVHHPRLGEHDVSSVEALSYAGAAMTSALAERCAAVFSPRIFVNHYGSTEIYTYTVHRDQRAKPGCAGRASLNARVRLVRTEPDAGPDDLVAPGEEGQIVCELASDEAFSGYWNRPDADEAGLRQGWFYTGDLGRLDADGDLWIVGRVDDMIVSGGENVHPLEVEDVLARHPGVREVAVVGAPDDRWGHRVVAYVVGEGKVTAEELDAHCLASETLARFKRPREYRFVEDLPKSPSGKLLRRLLRDERVSA
jgi:2-furoate---CoA ligase